MNIIVCIKQVPNVTKVKWDADGSLIRTGLPTIINPVDKNAVEAALQLKEQHGGKVTVISMGPSQVESALREALCMGVDDVIQLSDRKFAGADTWATSYTLGAAIKKIADFDLVITGVEAMDGNTAQVGPQIAEYLGLPLLSYALGIEVDGKNVRIKQKLGDVSRKLEAAMPALITVEKEINDYRVTPIDKVIDAFDKDIPVWGVDDVPADVVHLGLKGSPTKLRKVYSPKLEKGQVEMLQGTPEEIARQLVDKLNAKFLI
ncbi:electron transfer flavoprotein subunit beta/FixA family protein [Desulfatiferula olefinivorans]